MPHKFINGRWREVRYNDNLNYASPDAAIKRAKEAAARKPVIHPDRDHRGRFTGQDPPDPKWYTDQKAKEKKKGWW